MLASVTYPLSGATVEGILLITQYANANVGMDVGEYRLCNDYMIM